MRSIFSKILVSGLGIALFTAVALSLFLAGLFSDYFTSKYEATQNKALKEAELLTRRYVQGQMTEAGYGRGMQLIDRLQKTHFCVLDAQGTLIYETAPGIEGAPTQAMLNDVSHDTKRGSVLTEKFTDPDNSTLDILVTATSVPKATIVGYMLITDIYEPIRNVIHLVWLAAAVALIVAVIPTYIISRHFTSPFVQMSQAALKMGQGDFSVRVNAERADEIGQLAGILNYMAVQLEALEQTRQEFLANVSHELRTPLTSIRGFAQGILDGTVPASEQSTYLARIFAEAERLAGIVDDLLTLARLRSGHLCFNWIDVSPDVLLGEVFEILRPIAAEKNVRLAFAATENGGTINADRQRLTQVFINIIDNAIKFSPQGGTVEVRSSWRPTGFHVRITDEGPGIPPADLPNIFDRFYTGNLSSKKEYPGAGLGLAISKLIVDKHGGTISASNRMSGGCEITISLPLKKIPLT